MEIKIINLAFKVKKPILALGAHAKNTVCFVQGKFAHLSPILQNLNQPDDFLRFEKTVRLFLKNKPRIIAYDLHPEYQSAKYALDLSPSAYHLSPIQHHHAHIASCMADNQLKNQSVIGVAFDGTGLGSDNRIWGAEFLLCDYNNFQRRAHLKEIPLLGGESAISEPWRLTAAWLYQIYKDKFLDLSLSFLKSIGKNKWRVLKKMYASGLNSPLASSMGRLFDAAAVLTLGKTKAKFEAELAMELEKSASGYQSQSTAGYNFSILKTKDGYIIDPANIFQGIIADLKNKESKAKMAWRFHFAIAQMIHKTCLILRRDSGLNKVVLSGGVFQNKLLLRLALVLLYKDGFTVFTHRQLSCNDSCVSLGQALIAGHSKG